MTYEEVWKFYLGRTAQAENEKIKQRGEMVVKALEKQIPKKPTIDGYGYSIYDTWYCPNCDQIYEMKYEKHKYCPKCGQKIDWSEEKR